MTPSFYELTFAEKAAIIAHQFIFIRLLEDNSLLHRIFIVLADDVLIAHRLNNLVGRCSWQELVKVNGLCSLVFAGSETIYVKVEKPVVVRLHSGRIVHELWSFQLLIKIYVVLRWTAAVTVHQLHARLSRQLWQLFWLRLGQSWMMLFHFLEHFFN